MLSTPKAKAELFLASSLYDGLEDNNIMQVTTLLLNKEADPNVLIPSQGITPFHLVIGNDSETFAEEVTKLFLRHGGNPNVKSVDGMTPVHVAAAWGRLGVLELLLSNGGDPLLVDDDGRSPFHYAFDEAHYDAVATLGKYCGEPFEEDSDLKYNIVLDKILVSNGGIVAEYAVSEDSFSLPVGNVSTICTSKSFNNNNELLENQNQRFVPSVKTENKICELHPKYPAHNNDTITTTADETSSSLSTFVNVRRHRRCLPQKNLEHVEYKLGKEETIKRVKQAERDLLNENRLSTSHLNDPMIEALFHVETKKVGENMPRISSPKAKKKLVKSEHDAGIEYQDIGMIQAMPRDINCGNKLPYKTPPRSCSIRGPVVVVKKTPMVTSAKKIYDLNGRTTPNSGKYQLNDKRTLIRTPTKYISKKSSYSPDCSIVSKSPNLVRALVTPTNNYKLREGRSIALRSGGKQSVKDSKRIPTYGTSYTSPTANNICNKGNSGKNLSRFVKQSELRHERVKKTPVSSPSRFPDSPTWSKKSKCTPNLTDSTKRKKTISTGRTKVVLTPSYSTARTPLTPLDQTYSKNRCSDAAGFSPDVETVNRFVDRRSLDKKVAIKLEETMYDDHYEKGITSTDFANMKKICPIIRSARNVIKSTVNSEVPVITECQLTNVADKRLNRLNERMNAHCLTSNESDEMSGVHKLADSTKGSAKETAVGGDLSQSYNNSRGSKVIAGFFQPCNVDGISVESNANSAMNNAITPFVSRPYANILPDNFLRTENPIKPAIMPVVCVKHPNSKEIDDSLISSDCSSYSMENQGRDLINSPPFVNTDCPIQPEELLNNGSSRGNNAAESGFLLPRLAGESDLTNSRKTSSLYPNIFDSSNYMSFVSVEEEYKYEDAEEGVILLERRLLITPISIPMIKADNGIASFEKSNQSPHDESTNSRGSSLPHSLLIMDSDTLRKELTRLDCRPPGPITATTRHVYLKRLKKLQKHGSATKSLTTAAPIKFSAEIERTLRSENWTNDLSSYESLEQQVFSEFANPDPTRRWREGTIKSSFNYLLMDPRVTDNLPRRADMLSSSERWQTFLSSVFYVGKGRRSRPYAHLYEAYGEWKKGTKDTNDKKINCIMDIWKSNCGVVCLHLFQNTIPAEAYTREAAMIEALGLNRLKNLKAGDYYGVASTWSHHQKRTLGVYLLYKAMHILINEGERQLSPDDIGR